jgi:hypothetical protein
MLKRKADWTCSYCSKIFRDPIELPCQDSICRQHLLELQVVNEDKIKCNDCKQEFGVKENKFKSMKKFTKLIESESYLSDEEIKLKHELEESIGKFYDAFNQNKSKLESVVFDHFEEMRVQINEHRDKLKEKIDEIALKLIEETTNHEEIYLKEAFSSFDQSKSLEKELNELEELFRNPNLSIETIREMQQKREDSLNKIRLKLNEINQVKYDLRATNEFKPNSTLFNQNEASFFGSNVLYEYLSMSLIKSQLLNGEQQLSELIKLCEFSPNDKFTLLYRGTRDGFEPRDFHSKCDGHSNTLTIFKAKQSSFIFGGFTTADWDSSSGWKSDANAFLFSLTNKDNEPLKIKVSSKRLQYAIYCESDYGPTFGGEIRIANNPNTTKNSYSYLGKSYKHPQYAFGTKEADTFLAGSCYFQLAEIEVYKKEEK